LSHEATEQPQHPVLYNYENMVSMNFQNVNEPPTHKCFLTVGYDYHTSYIKSYV